MINHNDFMRAKWKTDREKERKKKFGKKHFIHRCDIGKECLRLTHIKVPR